MASSYSTVNEQLTYERSALACIFFLELRKTSKTKTKTKKYSEVFCLLYKLLTAFNSPQRKRTIMEPNTTIATVVVYELSV